MYDTFGPSLCLYSFQMVGDGLQDDSIVATSLPRPHTEWIFLFPWNVETKRTSMSQDA